VSLPAELQELLRPEAYPHAVEAVQLVETPISWVLLTGAYAYKIKRPVRLEYVDQQSAQRRAELCAEELRLNQRFAPELYLGVRSIARAAGRLVVGGTGEVVEHAVCMRQFDRSQELDRLLASGGVAPGELADFGARLAATHAMLARAAPSDPYGTPERVRALVLANLEQCLHAARALGACPGIEALRAPLTAALDAATPVIAQRRAAGMVRECHGDLHARNIVRREGRLLAFDCVEFEPAFRWIDVADDVAFLVADLEVLGAPLHAWSFLQGYLGANGDYQACRVQRLYQAHRALVRAKVAALSAADAAGAAAGAGGAMGRAHAAYLRHAAAMLGPLRPAVLLMSGLSGSGKTWLAERLAPALRALHLRSDVERKRCAGLAPEASSGSGLARGLYSAEATAELYRHLLRCTGDIVAGGRSAIVDATFLRPEDRLPWRELADAAGLPFRVIHCHAPPALLEERIERRRAAARDASEADLDVLGWQQQRSAPFAPGESATIIEADTAREDVVQQVLQQLGAVGLS
jgi:aminoglycoside phosphotransferase family enzyme/predicted kinase